MVYNATLDGITIMSSFCIFAKNLRNSHLSAFQQLCCLSHSGCAIQAFFPTDFKYGIEKRKDITILL